MFVDAARFQIKRVQRPGLPSTIEWMRLGNASRVPDASWFFNAAISQTGFGPLGLPTRVRKLISSVTKDAKIEIATKLMAAIPDLPLIRSLLSSVTTSVTNPKGIFVRNEQPFAIVLRSSEDSFVALTKSEDDCERVIDEFRASFTGLSEVTKDFGFKLGRFVAGRDFAKDWIKTNPDVKSLREREPTNDFEKEVIGQVRQVSSSFMPNVEVVFKGPSESTEYDVVSVLSGDRVSVIEAMDYQTVQDEIRRLKEATRTFKENIKSAVVLRTIDKTLRLHPGGSIGIVVFLRGFPGDVFSQLQKIAESRGLMLLNDEDLRTKIRALISYSVAHLEESPQQGFHDYFGDYRTFSKSLREALRNSKSSTA